MEELSPLGTLVMEEREENALQCSSACGCSVGEIKQGHRVQPLPGIHSQRHIHKYVLTAEVYDQMDTHTHTLMGKAKRHIIRITKRDAEEKVKEQREKRER